MIFTRPRLLTWTGAAAAAAVIVSALAIAAPAAQLEPGPAAPPPALTAGPTAVQRLLDPHFVAPDEGLRQVLVQPDGSRFPVTLSPAHTGGLFETLDGRSVERDTQGVWRYVLGRDRNGATQLSKLQVRAGKAPAGVPARAGRAVTEVDAAEARARAAIQRQLQIASLQAQQAATAAGEPRVFRVPALMLATWYDESKGQDAPQFQPGHDAAFFKDILDGFGGNPRGSVTQFYYEASFGQFLVQVDVFGPYTSARSIGDPCYYGGIDDSAGSTTDPIGTVLGVSGGGALGMMIEALPQANLDIGLDWDDYDNDGDGRVDFTMIIHSGGDMAATGNECYTWSHALQATLGQCENLVSTLGIPSSLCGRVGIPTSTPGTSIDRVLTIPEFSSETDPLTIGVAAHEMAHSLGEPDYYDTASLSTGDGDYDVMAGGSYMGTPSGSNPTQFNPASRVFQGWVTPTIVRRDLRGYTLEPRTRLPRKGYRVGQPDKNLLLVPTYEVAVGQTDALGHTWTEEDVYGLAYDARTKKYVVEGYYIENVSRHAVSPKINPEDPMGSMFDRRGHGSGLLVWHFDYWRQSTTYFAGANDAQNDPQRMQIDVEEFDRNDNTQELALNLSRGNPADYLTGAATGITSGTRMLPPGVRVPKGQSQRPIDIAGTTTPVTPGEATFTVEANKANLSMTVRVASDAVGDCKLQLVDPQGKAGEEVDAGSVGGAEELKVKNPRPGTWKAVVADFAACGTWSGRVLFEGATAFITTGAADTWSNWSKRPTGWAFTNVSGYGNGIDSSNEAGATDSIRLDVLNLARAKDVSPGFVTGALVRRTGGGLGINVGRANKLVVPVFSNGGRKPGKVQVTVREGSAEGKVVTSKVVRLKAYQRKAVRFRYRPTQEGPVRLVTTVDPADRVREKSERNQTQVTTLWAGPARPKVLVVDDDQVLAHEQAIAGGLASLGIPYAIATGHPKASVMKKYAAVIWEAAVDRGPGQLDAGDIKELTAYLDGGGKLLMTSNRVLDAVSAGGPEGAAFLARYFGARIPEGNATYVVSQPNLATVTGRGILGRKKLTITPPATRPFIGVAGLAQAGPNEHGQTVTPYGKATGIAQLDAKTLVGVVPEPDPAYVGVAVEGDRKHRGFRTVTLGWNLGDNVNAGHTVRVLQRVMRFFDVRYKRSRYVVRSAQPVIYHNAVRDQLSGRRTTISAIVLGGQRSARNGGKTVTLYYRTYGSRSFTAVVMRKSGRNAYSATIPGKAATPAGIEYYIRSGSSVSPFSPTKAPLYHGIGISLPK
jgi:M6 family metalloprotease-like protein